MYMEVSEKVEMRNERLPHAPAVVQEWVETHGMVQNNDAEAANRAKGQFLTSMSHEFRTPMNAILGMIDVALPRVTDSTVQDCLQTARGAAAMLSAFLNDLLESANVELGRGELGEESRFYFTVPLPVVQRLPAGNETQAVVSAAARAACCTSCWWTTIPPTRSWPRTSCRGGGIASRSLATAVKRSFCADRTATTRS